LWLPDITTHLSQLPNEQADPTARTMSSKQLICLLLAVLSFVGAASSSVSSVDDEKHRKGSISDRLFKPAAVAGERAPEELQEFLNGLKNARPSNGFRMKPVRMDENIKVPDYDQVSLHALTTHCQCFE
jgi:hypothetical protein